MKHTYASLHYIHFTLNLEMGTPEPCIYFYAKFEKWGPRAIPFYAKLINGVPLAIYFYTKFENLGP